MPKIANIPLCQMINDCCLAYAIKNIREWVTAHFRGSLEETLEIYWKNLEPSVGNLGIIKLMPILN